MRHAIRVLRFAVIAMLTVPLAGAVGNDGGARKDPVLTARHLNTAQGQITNINGVSVTVTWPGSSGRL